MILTYYVNYMYISTQYTVLEIECKYKRNYMYNRKILQAAKLNMYNLGVHLREIYDEFLGDAYTYEILKMRTTEYPLSMLSAQLVNAGLWPPSKNQTWHEDMKWQPIPTG